MLPSELIDFLRLSAVCGRTVDHLPDPMTLVRVPDHSTHLELIHRDARLVARDVRRSSHRTVSADGLISYRVSTYRLK